MDLASILSFAMGVVTVVFGIVSAGASMSSFIDTPSLIITVMGSITGTMGAFKMPDFIAGLKSFGIAMKNPPVSSAQDVITSIINLANISRKEGLLALEEATHDMEDEFLKKGIGLVVDGTDPELVRGILETELSNIEDRHKTVGKFWSKWAELGPAWGMIGTLIGLVNMLKNLTDSSTIGPNMAVALLTTLYGSLIANWVCSPINDKLSVDTNIEIMIKTITVEGLLSIQAGENPRLIEEKLKSFLLPKDREAMGSAADGGGGE